MEIKLKICDECLEEKVIWKNFEGNKYCLSCWNRIKPKKPSTSLPKKSKIAKSSVKRKEQNKEYKLVRDDYMLAHPYCEGNISFICTGKATELHHAGGRVGNLLTDTRYFKALCHACHVWAELNPKEAKEMGLSVSRLNI